MTPQALKALETLLERFWRQLTEPMGSRRAQRSRFGLVQVWASRGWRAQDHLERVVEWLLVEWPQDAPEPVKYWLAHVEPPLPGPRRRVCMAKACWRIELDDRELQEELGLDHDEGRHWLGWHHHVCWVSIAYACLRAEIYPAVLYFYYSFYLLFSLLKLQLMNLFPNMLSG
jgi:SRSO17 transposase